MIGIYKIENKINGKIYIGQSIDINRRLREHKNSLNNNKHYNNHLQYSFNKYGKDNFTFEIIDICEIDELDALERLYINKYECKHNEWGYNLEDGGHKGKKLSEETKEKLNEYWDSEEGQIRKKEISKQKQKYWDSEEGQIRKKELSKLKKGKKISEETKEKIKKTNSGKNNGMYGKHHTEKAKAKISKANLIDNLPSERELLNEYKTTKTSYKKLGEKYGCSKNTIMRRIKQALKNED